MLYRDNDPNGWRRVYFTESTLRDRPAPSDVLARFVLAFSVGATLLSLGAHALGWL